MDLVVDRRDKIEQVAVAAEHVAMGRGKPVQQVAAEGAHQVGCGHAGLARQRADHRHHLFVRVIAHGGVRTAVGCGHFVEHGIGDFGRELGFNQFDEFGEHESQHERSRWPVWIPGMLGTPAAAHRSKRGGIGPLSPLDTAAARSACQRIALRALANICRQALGADTSPPCQLICTLRNTRSGCGISALKRPSGVVTAVRPPGLPLGLNG